MQRQGPGASTWNAPERCLPPIWRNASTDLSSDAFLSCCFGNLPARGSLSHSPSSAPLYVSWKPAFVRLPEMYAVFRPVSFSNISSSWNEMPCIFYFLNETRTFPSCQNCVNLKSTIRFWFPNNWFYKTLGETLTKPLLKSSMWPEALVFHLR